MKGKLILRDKMNKFKSVSSMFICSMSISSDRNDFRVNISLETTANISRKIIFGQ